MLGLLILKPLGVLGGSWLAVRLGVAAPPEGVTRRHMAGAACFAGIGFTMSLFITELAFPTPGLEAAAKLGILVGSAASAAAGVAVRLTAGPTGGGLPSDGSLPASTPPHDAR